MNTIQLQAIGTVNAKPAGELVEGDVTVWNFGSLATVVGKVSETKAFVTLALKSEHGTHERKLKKSRLVGCK